MRSFRSDGLRRLRSPAQGFRSVEEQRSVSAGSDISSSSQSGRQISGPVGPARRGKAAGVGLPLARSACATDSSELSLWRYRVPICGA